MLTKSNDFEARRGVVYGAREAHNLTDKVQLLAPQQFDAPFQALLIASTSI